MVISKVNTDSLGKDTTKLNSVPFSDGIMRMGGQRNGLNCSVHLDFRKT